MANIKQYRRPHNTHPNPLVHAYGIRPDGTSVSYASFTRVNTRVNETDTSRTASLLSIYFHVQVKLSIEVKPHHTKLTQRYCDNITYYLTNEYYTELEEVNELDVYQNLEKIANNIHILAKDVQDDSFHNEAMPDMVNRRIQEFANRHAHIFHQFSPEDIKTTISVEVHLPQIVVIDTLDLIDYDAGRRKLIARKFYQPVVIQLPLATNGILTTMVPTQQRPNGLHAVYNRNSSNNVYGTNQ